MTSTSPAEHGDTPAAALPRAVSVSRLRIAKSGRVLVDDVSFTARFGAVTAVLGPNGAGKSSLVKAIAGVLPYEGDIAVDGKSLAALDAVDRARRIAYVPQHSELASPIPVFDVVAHGRYAHHAGRLRARAADRDATAEALERTHIASLAGRVFTTLSQGERQRVLIARALATEARVLVLDEPTAALDVGHALKLYALLRRLASEGYCVLAVIHALQEALDWTDDALLLDGGRALLFRGTRDVVFDPAVEAVYGVRLVPNAALAFRAS